MEPILFIRENEIKTKLNSISNDLPIIQNVIDEVLDLKIVDSITKEALIDLLSMGGRQWIEKQLLKQIEGTTFNGRPINPEKAIELIDIPDTRSLNNLVVIANKRTHSLHKYFILVKNKLRLIEKVEEIIKEEFTVYAKSKKEVELFQAFEKTTTCLKELNEYLINCTGSGLRSSQSLETYWLMPGRHYGTIGMQDLPIDIKFDVSWWLKTKFRTNN